MASAVGGIPAEPYIDPAPELLEKWRAIVQQAPGPRIGICWRGSQAVVAMRDRSIPPEDLRILGDTPATFISLQEGEAPPEAPAIHVLPGLEPFSMQLCDVAAVMRHLDLVITCDTSIAHLAGAVGVSVWVALKHNACWRWMLGRAVGAHGRVPQDPRDDVPRENGQSRVPGRTAVRPYGEDSPWYPTMRLFRQQVPNDWPGVLRQIADTLAPKLAGKGMAETAPTQSTDG